MLNNLNGNVLFCLKGCFHFNPERRKSGAQMGGVNAGRRSDVAVHCLPLPATPPPSTNPTPPHQCALLPNSGRQQSELHTVPASPSGSYPTLEVKQEIQEKESTTQPTVVSITESAELDWELNLAGPAGSERPESAASAVSQGSLSDLSRPPSSLFSRSTDLASGRSSVLSGKSSIYFLITDYLWKESLRFRIFSF